MGKLRSIILAGVSEDFLMHKSLEVVEANRKKGIQATKFYLSESSFEELVAMLNQSSLLGSDEFVWVREAELLKDSEIRKLKSLLESEISRQLLITAVEKKKRLRRWQEFSGIRGVRLKIYDEIEMETLSRELIKIASRYGKTLTGAAAEILLKRCQRNFSIASGELIKLIHYFSEKSVLTIDEVQAYVKELPSGKLFNFIDALLQHDLAAAAKRLDDVLAAGERPEAIFYVLLSTFTDSVRAATLFKSGADEREVASAIGLEEWQVSNYKRNSKRWSWDELVEAYWLMLDFDSKIKTGEIRNPADALKRFISVLAAA